MSDQQERARLFRELHQRDGDPLRLLNAWDAGSAKVLAAAGAPALGTTSAGVAFALGLPDGERLGRDQMLAAVRAISAAVTVPVTADLEAGYAADPAGVAETVGLAIEAGAVGLNIEDSRADGSLVAVDEQVERVAAAAAAAQDSGLAAFVNARTDTIWLRAGDEADTIARLRAYVDAGADGVFVPGAIDPGLLARLADATGAPLNVLVAPGLPPVPDLATLGVARISAGSGAVRAALSTAHAAATEMLGPGTYGAIAAGTLSYADVDAIMSGD